MKFTDEPYNPINYKIHLLIIISLLIILFFIVDIYSFFYLKHAYKECVSLKSPNSTVYMNGEYIPISKQESPSDYKFVTVKKQNSHIYETYYTSSGEKVVLKYTVDGKWQSSYDEGGINYFLLLPLCGLSLIVLAIIKKVFRTGEIFSWSLNKHSNDRFEKICLLYGTPLCISWIIFGMLGRI